MCDGRTYEAPDGRMVSTINARDRFIVASGGEYDVGDVGGAESVTLTTAQEPPHYHKTDGTDGSDKHLVRMGHDAAVDVGDLSSKLPYADDADYISSSRTSTEGGGQPHENRPPYIGLFLIKHR